LGHLLDAYPLRLVASHQIDADPFATHHFRLDEILNAYDVFAAAADTGAIKVVLTR
jgi:alcohol dehydrogenase